jgi:GGDEF domain-containing protein
MIYPRDGEDEKTLMKNADGALYRVKQREKNDFEFHAE